jgi:hypothetical protein
MNIPDGNDLAHNLREQFPSQSPTEIAAAREIKIQQEKLPLLYLAEVALHPPVITINTEALRILSETEVAEEKRNWFRAEQLQEVIVAHELYHILTKQPTNQFVEAQAHAFAQALTGLPFAPQVYEEILRSRLAQKN